MTAYAQPSREIRRDGVSVTGRHAFGGRTLVLLGTAALLGGCATTSVQSRVQAHAEGNDVLWLNRVTYGITSSTLGDYRQRGRAAFLDAQVRGADATLPAEIAVQIESLDIAHLDPVQTLSRVAAEYKRINALAEGVDKEQARKSLNEQGNKMAYEARRRELLRAIYSPAQLNEQMVAFWLNHFSVFEYKGNLRWLIGDYAEHAIRPHALGRFRDLVLATLKHPAMLQYLDNAQNAVGHVNENYARELMELHTLGVHGGYTQQDVQNLARILTGVGVYSGGEAPKLKPAWLPLYRQTGAFEFNPARHDFDTKTLLNTRIEGRGFAEVEQAVDLLVRSDACAHYISRKLAVYWVSDTPPAALVERLAQRFRDSDGDITTVLRALLTSSEFAASLGKKFKDPRQYVVSALRLAYDGRPIANAHPAVNWLNSLNEPQFGHQTPDGYPNTEAGWASSGQLSRRFEIARALGTASAGLFEPEDGGGAKAGGFPQLASRMYFDALEPLLSAATRRALNQANSQQEWNTFLLASPEFNYR